MQALGKVQLTLGEVQRQVAAATTHTLLLGAAGTGKTTALLHALAQAARRDGPQAVVGLAPSRSAARRWQAALSELGDGVLPPVLTVAGLATRVLGGPDEMTGAVDEPRPRILTAPEQDARIREILLGTVASHAVDWPVEWKQALPTREFARRLRRVVAHARRLGWDPAALQTLARDRGDPLWVAIGQFLEEYLAVLDWEGSVDHAEVVLRALRRLEAGGTSPYAAVTTVVADDVQDWGRLQARLVLAAGAPDLALIAAADPDQATGSYRGAELAALDVVRDAGADVVVADLGYRGGQRLRAARERLMGSRWYPGLPVDVAAPFRQPVVVAAAPDTVTAVEFDDLGSQSRHIADRLRRAHRRGLAWHDMAVLVTQPAVEVPELARTLARARIPVTVGAGAVPLAQDPVVATLLRAAALAIRPDWLAPSALGEWQTLVASELTGLPERESRRLARWLARETDAPGEADFRALVRDPALAGDAPADLRAAVAAVVSLGERLGATRRRHQRGGTPAEVLWDMWHGTGSGSGEWPDRLRRRAAGQGQAALAANRHLDAVVALFRIAERAPERWGGTRALPALLEEIAQQEIAAEPDLAGTRLQDAVEVLSVHRVAGRAWPFVVATGLSESGWRRAGFGGGPLEPGRLTEDDLLPAAPAPDAAERRRLFNTVLGRADRVLLLTCCGGPDDPPTALLAEAGLTVERVTGPPAEPRTPLDLLLRMRREALSGPPPRRAAAVAALPLLTEARAGDGTRLFPGMAAQQWPGVASWTVAEAPLRDPARPLSLSASALESLAACPLRWFLQREVRADPPSGPQARFGLVVHETVAALVAAGLPASAAEREALLDEAWAAEGYDAPWHERQERQLAAAALDRAHHWLSQRGGALASERPVDGVVAVTGTGGQVVDRIRVRGSIDLVERTETGTVVWDFKTRRSSTSVADAESNVQLAAYQAVLQAQAPDAEVAGAGLVQLCVPAGAAEPEAPKIRYQPGFGALSWAGEVFAGAAQAVRTEQFPAQPGAGCRTCAFSSACPARGARQGSS